VCYIQLPSRNCYDKQIVINAACKIVTTDGKTGGAMSGSTAERTENKSPDKSFVGPKNAAKLVRWSNSHCNAFADLWATIPSDCHPRLLAFQWVHDADSLSMAPLDVDSASKNGCGKLRRLSSAPAASKKDTLSKGERRLDRLSGEKSDTANSGPAVRHEMITAEDSLSAGKAPSGTTTEPFRRAGSSWNQAALPRFDTISNAAVLMAVSGCPATWSLARTDPRVSTIAASLLPRDTAVAKLSSTDILLAFDAFTLALTANWEIDAASTLEIVFVMV
jgi:hypothetical protein